MGFGAKFAFAVLANQSTGLDPDGAAAVRSLPRLCAMVEDSQSAEILAGTAPSWTLCCSQIVVLPFKILHTVCVYAETWPSKRQPLLDYMYSIWSSPGVVHMLCTFTVS
jgi:hypothetical protein